MQIRLPTKFQTSTQTQIKPYFKALRIRSWIGWLFFFGLGSTLFVVPPYTVLPISIAFSLVTAAIFVLNQHIDRKIDQTNPLKKNLPVASGELTPKQSTILFTTLFAAGLLVTALTNFSLLFLFITYIAVGIFYSVPPIHLKKRAIIDLITVGIGAGVLPFLIGMQAANQLSIDFSLPFILKQYENALLCIIPLFLFQASSHIFQAIGDFEADKKENINTFVVKYGKERSAKIGTLLSAMSLTFPIIYGLLNLATISQFVYWYALLLACFLPFIIYLLRRTAKPTTSNLEALRKVSQKATPLILLALFTVTLLLRIYIG